MATTKTGIQWTDATWNPTRGCRRVSPGCEHCYAEKMAGRFTGPGLWGEGLVRIGANGPRWTGEFREIPEALSIPLRWRKPRKIFVNSMSDLFGEGVSDQFISRVLAVMAICGMRERGKHEFQILTKRPERMRNILSGSVEHWRSLIAPIGAQMMKDGDGWFDALAYHMPWPLPNVWLGVSVEDQQRADERIPLLMSTPAAVRFLSCEPLLDHVDLRFAWQRGLDGTGFEDHADSRMQWHDGIHWLIVGGESGHGARVCEVKWIRRIMRQCKDAHVPVFVKQLGANVLDPPLNGGDRIRLKNKKGGDMAEWPADLRVREFP